MPSRFFDWDHTYEPARKYSPDDKEKYVQAVRYGLGTVVGVVAVKWLKRRLRRLPVLGPLLSPFLALVPTKLSGAALGAAAVYSIDEGDAMAVKNKLYPQVRRKLERVGSSVKRQLDELQNGIADVVRTQEDAVNKYLPNLERHVDDMGRRLTPVLEQEYRRAQRDLGGLMDDLDRDLAPHPQGRSGWDPPRDQDMFGEMQRRLSEAAALVPTMMQDSRGQPARGSRNHDSDDEY